MFSHLHFVSEIIFHHSLYAWTSNKDRPWTNFSWQDKTWAEFSTLEVAACHAMHLLHNIAIWPTVFCQVQCAYEYSAHLNFTMILGKKKFLFFKNNFTRINHCKFIHRKSHQLCTLSHLPSMFSAKGLFQHHFNVKNVKKCTLYSIKQDNLELKTLPNKF